MTRTPACLLGVVLVACSAGQQIRGTDRGALLPSLRATFALREPHQVPARRLAFEPTIEVGFDHVDGGYGQPGGRGDYRAESAYVAFAPELSLHRACLKPLAGFAWSEVEAEAPSLRVHDEHAGGTLGLEASWRGWSVLWPYARASSAGGADISIGRVELGVDLRASEAVGLRLAYARQTSEIELLGSGNGARIETEGLHLGISLRF